MRIIERLEGLRPIAPYLVIAFFIVSVAFSALSSEPGAIAMWLVFGLLGVIFLRVAFPRSYLYGIWLLTVYLLTGVAVLFFNQVGLTGGQAVGVGILLEVIAIYIIYHLVFQVKGLRDIGEGPYVPLGLWSMAVLAFFVFSNVSAASLVGWALAKEGTANLGGYVTFEVLLVLTVVFIFVRAEECVLYLEEGAKALREGVMDRTTAKAAISRRERAVKAGPQKKVRKKLARTEGGCPVCKADLKVVRRSCPECGAKEETAICASGHGFLPCPSCGTANFHGDFRCKRCNAKLSENILCRKCGVESGLHLWRRASAKKG